MLANTLVVEVEITRSYIAATQEVTMKKTVDPRIAASKDKGVVKTGGGAIHY